MTPPRPWPNNAKEVRDLAAELARERGVEVTPGELELPDQLLGALADDHGIAHVTLQLERPPFERAGA